MSLTEDATNVRQALGVLDRADVNVSATFLLKTYCTKSFKQFFLFLLPNKACNCNSGGAKSIICDRESGQCDCYDKIEGKLCDVCQKNYWNFPKCQNCKCNGYADSCNQTSGRCIDCRDHTVGYSCEE